MYREAKRGERPYPFGRDGLEEEEPREEEPREEEKTDPSGISFEDWFND